MTEAQDSSTPIMNLETWMRDLPESLKDLPFIYLAIPGSHDSMTYGITRSSTLAPDAEPILNRLYPLFRGTIIRWTITQAVDTMQQLRIGIRYLDLRIATKTGTEHFFFTHGLYAEEISKALIQVKEFVDTHPGEVIILDCQHFYGFTLEDHKRLILYLFNLYGAKLVPRPLDLRRLTLNSLSDSGQQVIIVYRHQIAHSSSDFWYPQSLPSPWPQQDRISGLLNYLQHIKRSPGTGFVHQAVLTPTPSFILFRWFSSLREKCAIPVMKEVLPKLADFTPGPPLLTSNNSSYSPVNVVIADFVDMNDAVFPQTIIQLNFKLLRNTDTVYHM